MDVGTIFGLKLTLDKDKIIKKARATTGLQDLGSDFWDEPLDRLITSINNEAELHPIGIIITKNRLQNLLATRLRAEYWFKKHPEILDQDLYPVTLIAGLQRTGTTKLHRLLGSDPDNRTLLSWEALNPAPFLNHNPDRDPRIKFARMAENALKIMSPTFFTIHPVEHLAEEEDILLLDVSFMSTTAEATMYVPSYAAWLEQTDQTPAYSYAAKLLKLLQWQKPGKRWVLKSPHHLEFLDLAKNEFGDIRFIWTHRNVQHCIPSFLSMLAHGHSLFKKNVSIENLTSHWIRKIQYMLQKAISFRNLSRQNTSFTDIFYDDLINDPFSQLEKIYSPLDGINQSLMRKFEMTNQKNYRGKYGLHTYKADDFNLTEAKIDSLFNFYTSYMNTLVHSSTNNPYNERKRSI